MKLEELINKLNWKVVAGHNGLDKEVSGAYVSDLLSDVIGCATQGEIWLTLQTHKNSVAVASLKDLAAILIVKDLSPDEDTIAKANEEGIALLSCSDETFEATGKLYMELKSSGVV